MSHQEEINALVAGSPYVAEAARRAETSVAPEAIKLCRDCAFFILDGQKCGHDSAFLPDFVNGKHTRFGAATHRGNWGGAEKDCGRSAQFFSPAVQS